VISEVEQSIRALKLLESEVQGASNRSPPRTSASTDLEPCPHRSRASRAQPVSPGFHEVADEVAGWVIRWKEYTHRGTVRGFGQFYERPYAWLEE
jgi:hypothetical protein